MALDVWKGGCFVLLLVVFSQFYFIISNNGVSTKLNGLPTFGSPHRQHLGKWTYDSDRDSANTGLTLAQCDAAFPDLYYEIDRAVAYWRERNHTITPDDTSIDWRHNGAMQLLVHDNQVRVLRTKNVWPPHGYGIRALPTVAQLHRALLGATAAGESIPDVEFAVTVDDMSLIGGGKKNTHSIFAYTRRKKDRAQDRLWLMPDFMFWSNPPKATSWQEMQRRSRAFDSDIAGKIPKVVWRGNPNTNKRVRYGLLNVTEGKDWADVEATTKEDKLKYENNEGGTTFIPMEDLCRYAFPVHTAGRSWSGRLKFILNCNSVPIIHKLGWTAHFYHLLKRKGPEQNYVWTERDFSDLEGKVTYYLDHPNEAQKIADNAAATFRSRYTSLAADSCYWRKLLIGYSQVSFVPEPYDSVGVDVSGKLMEQRQLRGIAYEEIMLLQGDYPPDP